MTRFIGATAFLLMLAAIVIWVVPREMIGTAAISATTVPLNSASLNRAQLDTATANAQQTATADIQQAHDRATFSAAVSTQDAAQTQALLQQTQAQFSLRLTANSATDSAAATATQRRHDDDAAGTTTAVAGVFIAQTQSVVVTQQEAADQARQTEAQEQATADLFWAWGPPLFLLVVVALCLWAFWYLEIRKRALPWPGPMLAAQPLAPPALPIPTLPVAALPAPRATVVIDPDPITQPDAEVSGWLEEVKESLRESDREENDN